jgi:cytoskeleton protein RodZ
LPSFGEKLKQEREKRKITLEEISYSTKIGTRMLQALEENKFNQLPGGIFNKGFVRAYSRAVGLDEDQIVADYLQASGDAPPVRTEIATRESGTRESERENHDRQNEENVRRLEAVNDSPRRSLPWGLFAAVLLIMALVLFYWAHRQREHAKQSGKSEQSEAPAAPALTQSSSVVQNGVISTRDLSSAGATTSHPPVATTQAAPPAALHSTSPTRAAAGEFTLDIQVREESWVSITSDGNKIESVLMPAGSERSIHARKEAVVKVGNAGGVDFHFNGNKLATGGEYGEVKTVTFGPLGVVPTPPAPSAAP